MLIQAMMTVNDMFMTSRDHVQSIFLEEVDQFLFENDIRVTENISFTGKSGFPQTFHFVIPRSRQHPERLLHALNILNDSEKPIRTGIINALHEYDVQPILWSSRKSYIKELTG
jgi:hypothetical protein